MEGSTWYISRAGRGEEAALAPGQLPGHPEVTFFSKDVPTIASLGSERSFYSFGSTPVVIKYFLKTKRY